jgi:hypothetical protein
MYTSHNDNPTVFDQIRALYGIGDVVLSMAQAADEKDKVALEFIATAIRVATGTLDSTLDKDHDRQTYRGEGFPGPFDHIPDDSIPLKGPDPSTTISN